MLPVHTLLASRTCPCYSQASRYAKALPAAAALALAGTVAAACLRHVAGGGGNGDAKVVAQARDSAERELMHPQELGFAMGGIAPMDTPPPALPAATAVAQAAPTPVPMTATSWTSTTSKPYPNSTQDWPSLFCWLLSQTIGGKAVNRKQGWWEEKLVWEMYMQKVGIFACNDFAVFTDKKALVSRFEGFGWPYLEDDYAPKEGEVVSWALGSTQTTKNGDSSPSNTWVFVEAWKALGKSGKLLSHNWVVKQDPDAVFFPWRLRWHMGNWPNKDGKTPTYIKNCQTFHSMQGPLEVFSVALVKLLLPRIQTCGRGKPGEDSKMQKCAKEVGGAAFMDANILDDKYCNHHMPNCWNGNIAAFHPFKEIPNFRACVEHSLHTEHAFQKAKGLPTR